MIYCNLRFFGGGGGSSYSEQYRKRDPDSAEITNLQNTLYNQFTPIANGIYSDYAAGDARYKDYQNKFDNAYTGLKNLTETGNLPSGLTDSMNNAITRNMNKSLGEAMAKSAGNGVLNSSVTNRAINEIGTNTADAFAKNYLSAYEAASGNYGNLMSGAAAEKDSIYSDISTKLAPMLEFYKTVRASEDQDDYDTVVYSDGGGGS